MEFVSVEGTVHTNPDKFENAFVFLRFCLPFTLKRRFRSPKTELFENGLWSGEIWKRRLGRIVWTENILSVFKFIRISVDGTENKPGIYSQFCGLKY